MVDVLEAGVRVEAQHNNGQRRQQTLQDRQRVPPANALHAPRELLLSDLVDAVDVKAPLVFVEAALVHRVHPTPALAATRTRLTVRTSRRLRGTGGSESNEQPHVRLGAEHVVRVTVLDHRQAFVAGIPEDIGMPVAAGPS